MDVILNKLNYKLQKNVMVLQAPDTFELQLGILRQNSNVIVHRHESTVGFAVLFVTQKVEIEQMVGWIVPMLEADAVFWICYPKGSSKRYKCDFNRDNGWTALGAYEMEPVRQVAIDEDWSALRFRNVKYIKTLKRDAAWALSSEGKKRLSTHNK